VINLTSYLPLDEVDAVAFSHLAEWLTVPRTLLFVHVGEELRGQV
jgi:hypothetical protein